MLVGIDSLENKRMEDLYKNPKFLEKYFTEYEMEYCQNSPYKLSGIFCVKEAFLKAIGEGIGGSVGLKEIEVNHTQKGAPYIKENPKILETIKNANCSEIKISITHTCLITTAICVVY